MKVSEGSRFLAKTSLRVNENNVSQVMESRIVQLVPRIEFDFKISLMLLSAVNSPS